VPTALHRSFDWRGPDRLVLVHGFTQTLRSWDRLTDDLAETFQVVRVDLPGHGGSSAVELDFAATAASIGEAGGADPGERAARVAADDELAGQIERSGTVAFLERWLAQPMFATLTLDAADLEARMDNSPAGLAGALRRLGTGAQEPLWDRLGELEMPVLLVTGQEDARFCALAEQMAGAIGPNAQVVALAGAGHAAHLERPASFGRLLAAFLVLQASTP